MSYETLNDLYEALGEFVESGYGACKLRGAIQPNWPLAVNLVNVHYADPDEDDNDDDGTIWIACNDGVSSYEHPYAPRDAWDRW